MFRAVLHDRSFRYVGAALLLMAALDACTRVVGAQNAPPDERTPERPDAATPEPTPDAAAPTVTENIAAADGGTPAVDAGAAPADAAAPPSGDASEPPATEEAPAPPRELEAEVVQPPPEPVPAEATIPVPTAASEPAPLDPQQDCEAGAACSGELRARANADWISAARAVWATSRSGGDLFGAQTELRPSLRLDHGTWLQVVAQLRFGIDGATEHEANGWSARRSYLAKIIQLYAQWRFNEHLSLAVGFQSFQWGPAELLTPSNRLFRVLTLLRDPLFVVYGRGLVRVNLSFGKSLSAVLLAEVVPNGEHAFVAGQRFERDALAKVEYSTDDGSAYLGITAGAKQTGRGWFGEYASWLMTDGLSIYADASHSVGGSAWYPEVRPESPTPVFTQRLRESKRLQTLALVGARYAFLNGIDVRCEYLLNDAGYTRNDMKLAAIAASAISQHPELAEPYAYPGYEILARHLVYASVRVPDLPPNKRTTLQARYVISLTDRGGAFVLAITSDVADRHTVFLSALATHGPSYAEISRVARGYAFLGWIVSI